jgi:hypothetical protein
MSVCVQQETLTKHLSADLGLNAVSDPKVLRVCPSRPRQGKMEWNGRHFAGQDRNCDSPTMDGHPLPRWIESF